MKTKREALEAARKLKARMKRGRWRMRVWENLGWHYSIEAGPPEGTLSVSPSITRNRFFCLLGECGSGLSVWTEHRCYSDPNKAVERQLASARRVLDETTARHQKIIDLASRAAGGEDVS